MACLHGWNVKRVEVYAIHQDLTGAVHYQRKIITEDDARKWVLILFAGWAACHAHSIEEPAGGIEGDLAKAGAWADDWDLSLDRLARDALRLIKQPGVRTAVQAVADELLRKPVIGDRRTLTGHEVKSIIKGVVRARRLQNSSTGP
jgi:hypothetical protein